MAKKAAEQEEKKVIVCKLCKHENDLRLRICENCGGFLPRKAEVDATIAALNKKYRKEEGDNLICRMGDHPFYASSLPPISTGSLKLDKALLGGYPMSSRVMIAGDENSGKTTLALQAVAAVQARGGVVVYIDLEQALDIEYAKRIGVNVSDLIIAKPESGTEALDYLLAMAPVSDLIVLDSIAACASIDSINKETKVNTDGEVEQRYDVGDLARLMSGFQPKLMNVVAKTTCSFIFINQLRTQINKQNPAYSPQKPMGGRAVKYFCNVILNIRTEEELFNDDVYLGRKSVVKIVRAKHLGVWQTTHIQIGNSGVDVVQEVIDLAIEYGIIRAAGSWFSFEGSEKDKENPGWKVQGIASVKEKIVENPRQYQLMKTAVAAKIEEAHNEAKSYGARLDEVIENGEVEDGD